MAFSNQSAPPLQKLLSYPIFEWLHFFLDLFRYIHQLIDNQLHKGMYEIIDYESTLELVDPKGKTVIFKKRQRVKFTQDNIIAFQDYAWGDGQIFADYRCEPGEVVDRYQEGDRWNVLISLRETKNKGFLEQKDETVR